MYTLMLIFCVTALVDTNFSEFQSYCSSLSEFSFSICACIHVYTYFSNFDEVYIQKYKTIVTMTT